MAIVGGQATLPAEVQAAIAQHNLIEGFVHTNLIASQCTCVSVLSAPASTVQTPRATSVVDGGICFHCGGLTVRTGTCRTCQECGSSDGCG